MDGGGGFLTRRGGGTQIRFQDLQRGLRDESTTAADSCCSRSMSERAATICSTDGVIDRPLIGFRLCQGHQDRTNVVTQVTNGIGQHVQQFGMAGRIVAVVHVDRIDQAPSEQDSTGDWRGFDRMPDCRLSTVWPTRTADCIAVPSAHSPLVPPHIPGRCRSSGSPSVRAPPRRVSPSAGVGLARRPNDTREHHHRVHRRAACHRFACR